MPADPTRLDAVSIDGFIGRCSPFGGDQPVCDLCEFTMITPGALVQLAAGCYGASLQGRALSIKISDESVRGYLMRAGFFNTLGDSVSVDPPLPVSAILYEARRGSNPMLVEVTRLSHGGELPNLLDQIVWALRHRLKYRKNDAFDVATAISEACQNTFDHNADSSGFIAMQGYGKGAKRFIEIGISDCGVGLAATLRRNPQNGNIPNDRVAIEVATRLGTSEHVDPTRGTGLFHLLEIAYRHGGSVQIKSGAAKVRYRMDKRQGWAFSVPATAGVHLALTLPTKAA